MDHADLHRRVRTRGVNPIVYWLVRGVLQPFFHVYFRLSRIGREHIPAEGPVILAANHRSFLDPFVIGTLMRRPVYYVAKKELFERRWQAWILNSLGAFPVDRGRADGSMVESAKAILARGDAVVIFPEGTRVRPGGLGRPRRGVGRLALETGAPVVPVAVIGTEAIRRGWRIRPHKVRLRVGRPLTFPKVAEASPALAAAVTDRVWPCVMLQWEWLGGLPPIRRAAVLGNGRWAHRLATTLRAAGVRVESTGDLAATAAGPDLRSMDLVCFADRPADLVAGVARHASELSPQTGILVAPPLGAVAGIVSERLPGHRLAILEEAPELTIRSTDPGLARQVRDVLAAGGAEAATAPGAAPRRRPAVRAA